MMRIYTNLELCKQKRLLRINLSELVLGCIDAENSKNRIFSSNLSELLSEMLPEIFSENMSGI